MMVGTVSYMPPEQATGGAVTPRSDLYSPGRDALRDGDRPAAVRRRRGVAIIGQHLNTPPVSPTWHRPDCPPGLEALILRLLEKDPSKRPASAGEVRAALESIAALAASRPLRGVEPGSPSPWRERAGVRAKPEHQTAPSAALDNPLYRRIFVGREPELRQLQAAFDAALSGQGALVMVVGEPGIGKTALCEQLATYATLRGGKTLVGHCYEEGSLSLPYLPFVEAMRSLRAGPRAGGAAGGAGLGAADVARIVSEVRERLGGRAAPARRRRRRTAGGCCRPSPASCATPARVQPLVIVLEDLHGPTAARSTCCCTWRATCRARGCWWSAPTATSRSTAPIRCRRRWPSCGAAPSFRPRAAARPDGATRCSGCCRRSAGRRCPGALAEAIHRQTEGNPLFVQEVAALPGRGGPDHAARAAARRRTASERDAAAR